MHDRIASLLKHLNLTSANFADRIGVQRSSISHVLSGRNKPSLEFIQKTANAFPDISLEWLISGIGAIEKGSNSKSAPTMMPLDETSKNTLEKVVKANEDKNPIKEEIKKTPKSAKSIEKLILVYDDKTFEEIQPID